MLVLSWAAIGFGLVIGALAAWTLWHGAQDALAWLMERSPRRLPPVEPPDDEAVTGVG